MALIKISLSLLILIFFHQTCSQELCLVKARHENGFWWHEEIRHYSLERQPGEYPTCCDGYTFNAIAGCDPACPPEECVHAYCPLENNVNCHCYNDSHYPTQTNCQPTCTPNQNCLQTESCRTNCTCLPGFTKDVRTKKCVPTECYKRCATGLCSHFGVCVECNDHSANLNDKTGICKVLYCVQKCTNGECNNDGLCVCNKGFKTSQEDQFKCHKIICPSSQIVDNLFCKSLCDSKCINGNCSPEGRCNCNKGFKASPEDRFKCQEIICPSTHSEDNFFCKSLCDSKRINGNCSPEGRFVCTKGFKMGQKDRFKCHKIICPSSLNEDNLFCKSFCDSKCINGNCSPKGRCVCNKGFKISPEDPFKCQEIICPSSQSEDNSFCQSLCDLKCINGNCSLEGRCVCTEGFKVSPEDPFKCQEIICPSTKSDDNSFCKSLCYTKCTNGICSPEGSCNCNKGFKISPEDRYECEEIICPSTQSEDNLFCESLCDLKCINGNCSAEGNCVCNEGFKVSPEDRFNCQEIICPLTQSEDNLFCETLCDLKCINGNCSPEGNCVCTEGFKVSPEDRFNCQEITCPALLSEDNLFCETLCDSKCFNGNCSPEGRCICMDGFQVSPEDHFECQEINCSLPDNQADLFCKIQCTANCINGNCSDNNECVCKEKTRNVNGSCVALKIQFGVWSMPWMGVCITVFVIAFGAVGFAVFSITKRCKKNSSSRTDEVIELKEDGVQNRLLELDLTSEIPKP